jgi:hypothetical protein
VRLFLWRKSSAAGLASCQGNLTEIEDDPVPCPVCRSMSPDPIAFSSEVDTGSRKENASKQKNRARF